MIREQGHGVAVIPDRAASCAEETRMTFFSEWVSNSEAAAARENMAQKRSFSGPFFEN
jgi:hypothetical protein